MILPRFNLPNKPLTGIASMQSKALDNGH